MNNNGQSAHAHSRSPRGGRSFNSSKGFGGRKDFSAGRSFGARGGSGYRGGGNRGGRGRGFPVKKIDVSRYVNKNVETVVVKPYDPKHRFIDFAISDSLKSNITKKGYEHPTPIQDQAIPVVIEGKDIVGLANTGTGKTGAFLIPLIDKVIRDKNTEILIVAPTRELAFQINDEFVSFARGLGMFSVCCVGGAPIQNQIRQLRYKNNFVIGTPGRIKDLIERKALDLNKFSTIVLDEADRMLDMGFIGDMRFMMAKMPKKRHTLFFSATLSPEIKNLIGEFLHEPVYISVKTGDTSKSIEQDIVKILAGTNKIDVLHELLAKEEFERVLVFGRTKHGVEKISDALIQKGFKSASIHGNKSQPQRQRALRDFKDSKVKILVATDVAARGLDIPDVTHVINYDIPATHEDYIHRIGRTGRGGKKGKALTFVD